MPHTVHIPDATVEDDLRKIGDDIVHLISKTPYLFMPSNSSTIKALIKIPNLFHHDKIPNLPSLPLMTQKQQILTQTIDPLTSDKLNFSNTHGMPLLDVNALPLEIEVLSSSYVASSITDAPSSEGDSRSLGKSEPASTTSYFPGSIISKSINTMTQLQRQRSLTRLLLLLHL